MLQDVAEVIHEGDASGNGMIVRIPFPSGMEIVGLATRNFYGGDWDFGPTWNYLVLADTTFLLDTGRDGMGRKLLEMMQASGLSSRDLDSLIVSHGHEDHDGGMWDVAEATGAAVKAHPIYERLVRFYPDETPPDAREDFPASCWHCFMPESFSSRHCREYHRARNRLEIEPIEEGSVRLGDAIEASHLPGHSPDALALLVGNEAVLVGDTVLPEITPFPTREAFFQQVKEILPSEYSTADSVYGLRAYLRSLKKLRGIAESLPGALVLPAHRLFHNGRWNELDLRTRIAEIIDHHIQRCADILRILNHGPRTAGQIALEHFSASSLEGSGMLMAENEIISHCELLGVAGDVRPAGDGGFAATGSEQFESEIRSLSCE
jgi:glyoxylase-like metal-dependent hydrolase (beta-lactamase superfamily II)